MADLEECELHEGALAFGLQDPDTLLRLAHSPIGDECRSCPVCRTAREYVERRLDERVGRAFAPGEGGDAAWRRLKTAIEGARQTVRGKS